MNEECLATQQAISRAADGEKVSAEDAAAAKRHCATCPECGAFVATLAAVKRAPTPTAPDDTVARALAAVRAEAEAAAAAARRAERDQEAAQRAAASTAAGDASGSEPAADIVELDGAKPRRRKPSPAAVAGWIAGAAALLFVAMFVTALGLDYIASEPEQNSLRVADTTSDAGSSDTSALQSESAPSDSAITSPAPSYVAFKGFAYRFREVATVRPEDLPALGQTATALDRGGDPEVHNVYQGDEAGRIVVDDEGTALVFELVTRDYDGTTFALETSNIDAYGMWPTLPASIPQPSLPSGGPEFVQFGESDGVTIYVRPDGDPDEGFAVGPDTPASDPAAGNPNWTWWVPVD